jgi:hypothetical protein
MKPIALALALTLGHCTPAAVTPGAEGSRLVSRCTQYESVARRAGWPAHAIGRVSRITWRESRCTPGAYNGKGRDRSYGLMQINTKGALWGELQRRCKLTSRDQLFTPAVNLACAYKLYLAYGWKPWGL